ncbi:THUMP domain-containing class I SAM-dependent RNA methyltransferase [Parvularcula oceani]|uniref:THUMP domain-containing class I SAM-dependent RNA methyltransferase n=1 Tax=Parvularcula oceani TaxID=1247963 RepID=UPI0004E0CFD9|nr:RNA methyltransferase [Parvularcula oceani]
MTASDDRDLFFACPPGLEPLLRSEAKAAGFRATRALPGGVHARGGWEEAWRANLQLRGASRVLVRLAQFRATQLSELERKAGAAGWRGLLAPGTPFRVEASCSRSKIYHSGAAQERAERAIGAATRALPSPDAGLRILLRIDRDICTLSVDSSGEPLHRRGFKQAVAKAPMRETMAALFLRACGYKGEEPLLDPMCGSGTFPIEAAEIASGLWPGRGRSFAFERLANFDADAWASLKDTMPARQTDLRFFGSDRNAGAVEASRANAGRAGLASITTFAQMQVSEFTPPEGPKGLVMVNPPYGARIGDTGALAPLYAALGRTLRERFEGWRVGLVTSEPRLARATGLPFLDPGPPVPHGPLRVQLFRTSALGD